MATPVIDQAGLSVDERTSARLGVLAGPWSWRWVTRRRWEYAVAVLGVVGAAAALWLTLNAGFLQYPGWLAVQKADFIIGPIGVGLYWRHRRPHNRLGLLLIILGLLGVVYILQSSSVPALFGIGLLCEFVIGFWTVVVILAFPSGRLDGLVARLIAGVWLIGVVIPGLVLCLTAPSLVPSLSISGCKTVCPRNGLAVWPPPSWLPQLQHVMEVIVIAGPLAIASVLVWRFVTGTPPRRRALAIGAPIALLFLLAEAAYWTEYLLYSNSGATTDEPINGALQWTYAGAPSVLWYGFLFALIAAELFAGRVLRDVVRRSLGRPSLRELERMLREPLGDPGLRLGFWRASTGEWVGRRDAALEPPELGQVLTVVDRDGRPAAAIVHDVQLSEDPELLQAAGAAALLAQENAELETAWRESLEELSDSRARLVQAGDRERRKLERDLHDGAQQRLVSVQVGLRLAQEEVGDPRLGRRLEAIGVQAAEAVEELRALSHGIYPPVLRSGGLVRALGSLAMRATVPVRVTDEGVGRCPPPVDAAIYFCSAEAVQNAIKHAGSHVRVAITVGRDRERVRFAISDDGVGIDRSAPAEGDGLTGMRDRVGAVGGELEIVSWPGKGTTVRGTIPDPDVEAEAEHRGGAS